MVGATLAATDVICTLAFIKEDKTPQLHSILFGESVTNDAIAIVLLQTVSQVDVGKMDVGSFFAVIGEFIYICTISVLIGIFFGFFCAFIMKNCAAIGKGHGREAAMILYILWIGYMAALLIDASGVICVLTSSIVAGHYAMMNLTKRGRLVTANVLHFLADGCEALVFAYLGLTSYSYDVFSMPLLFLFLMFLGMIAIRFVGSYILCYLATLFTCGKYRLSFKSLSVIWVGGIVRGGISFALAISITGNHAEIMRITILTLVMGGTIICGTLLPICVRIMNFTESPAMGASSENLGGERWKRIDEKYLMRIFVRDDYESIDAEDS